LVVVQFKLHHYRFFGIIAILAGIGIKLKDLKFKRKLPLT